MQKQINRKAGRRRIRHRIRKKIRGTASRPRVAVFRSLRHIYAQAIDDENERTLASASSQSKKLSKGGDIEAARQVGALLAKKLKSSGVESAVFDRGGFIYHGRVKALADAARETGLKF